MARLRVWNDISVHRTSAGLFLLGWLGVMAFTFLTGADGMPDLAVWLHVAAAIIAGALVSWWQFPAWEGLLANGWRPAAPPLAGAFVAIAIVSAVFIREGVIAAWSGEWSITRGAELFVSWLVASAILGAIGLLCGLSGGMASRFLAKHTRPRTGHPNLH